MSNSFLLIKHKCIGLNKNRGAIYQDMVAEHVWLFLFVFLYLFSTFQYLIWTKKGNPFCEELARANNV